MVQQSTSSSLSEFEIRCMELREQRALESAERARLSERHWNPVRFRVLDWVLGKVFRG